MAHKLPSDSEIRERILAVGNYSEKLKFGFMYMYLIAGRVSEVFGKYAPRGDDVFLTDFNGEPAALFAVKTAKRRGMLRPVALPLRQDYEPWADEVRHYFTRHRGKYPFRLHGNWETSKTYAMKAATQALRGLEWPMIEYTRTMVEGEEKLTIKVPHRWKHATSHVFRKRRTVTLVLDYDMDPISLAWIGGWTEHSQAANLPVAVKHYLYMDVGEVDAALPILKRMATRYFTKLCKKYEGW